MDEDPGDDADRLAALAASLVAALPFRPARRSLDAARTLHRRAGAPRVTPTIVVVGTNGKTSTTTLAERMLAAGGRRTAAFVSPHLDAWNERLRIDGRPVDAGRLADALAAVAGLRGAPPGRPADRPGRGDLRVFDLLTIAAAGIARDAGVDAAVFEAGLGGRTDATALLAPDVVAVTRVALDHTELLGTTREAIYREKVGAARVGTAIVVAPSSADLVATAAHPAGSTVEVVPAVLVDAVGRARPGAADEEVENAALAAFALTRLPEPLRPRDPAAVAVAVDAAVPGRWERRSVAGVTTLADAGHNPDAWLRLAAALRAAPPRPRTVVFAATRERSATGIARALAAMPPASLVLTTTPGRASADPDAVAAAVGGSATVIVDPAAALDAALARARRDRAELVVTGSVFLVAAFRRWAAGRDRAADGSAAS